MGKRQPIHWSSLIYGPEARRRILANATPSQHTSPPAAGATLLALVPAGAGAISAGHFPMPAAVRRMDEYMDREGIGLKEMAARCHMSERSLGRFRADQWLSDRVLEKVAKVVGLSLEDFRKP
jgi:hypothetical protein